MATEMTAKSVFAHLYVRLSYICCVKSGKTAPRRFPVQNPSGIKPKRKSNASACAIFDRAGTYDTCFGLPTQMTHMGRNLTETKGRSQSAMGA